MHGNFTRARPDPPSPAVAGGRRQQLFRRSRRPPPGAPPPPQPPRRSSRSSHRLTRLKSMTRCRQPRGLDSGSRGPLRRRRPPPPLSLEPRSSPRPASPALLRVRLPARRASSPPTGHAPSSAASCPRPRTGLRRLSALLPRPRTACRCPSELGASRPSSRLTLPAKCSG
jgi:hypothetical protein